MKRKIEWCIDTTIYHKLLRYFYLYLTLVNCYLDNIGALSFLKKKRQQHISLKELYGGECRKLSFLYC